MALTMTKAAAARLAALHGAVTLCALLASPRAGLAAGVISILALARYGAMAAFASGLGRRPAATGALVAGAWLAAGLALVVALAAVARLARPCLPWALVAALAGPLEILAEALVAGFRDLAAAAGEGRAA